MACDAEQIEQRPRRFGHANNMRHANGSRLVIVTLPDRHPHRAETEALFGAMLRAVAES